MSGARDRLIDQLNSSREWFGDLPFDIRELQVVRVNGDKVSFYLESGPLTMPITGLNREEAAVALKYLSEEDGPPQDENTFKPPVDNGDNVEESPLEESPAIRENIVSEPAGPEWTFRKIRIIIGISLVIICFLVIIGSSTIDYINDIPYNNDKTAAIAIVQQDSHIQNFAGQKDISIDYTVEYYNIERQMTTKEKSNYMHVEAFVTDFAGMMNHSTQDTGEQPFHMYQVYIVVDLPDKRIISSNYHQMI